MYGFSIVVIVIKRASHSQDTPKKKGGAGRGDDAPFTPNRDDPDEMLVYNIGRELKAAGAGKHQDFLKCLSLLTAGVLGADDVPPPLPVLSGHAASLTPY